MLGKVSGALNHDFCPWANRYVYWLKKPIGWVILAFLSSILLGLYVSPQAFLASAGIASVAIIGSLWPWISMLGIRGQLSWNATRCQELESIQTTLVIANRWPWPAYGLSLDLDPGLACEGFDKQRISLQKIPGFAKSTFTWSTVPQRRGQYPRQEVHLQTAFPFGIWNSSQPIAVPEPLIVWPRSTRLIDSPTQIASQQFGTGSLSDRVGDEGDWTGVRPYRPGDSLRQVHWAQTARRDALVVFERQARRQSKCSHWTRCPKGSQRKSPDPRCDASNIDLLGQTVPPSSLVGLYRLRWQTRDFRHRRALCAIPPPTLSGSFSPLEP